MLACVSTLTDIVSYQDVRHSKEWLTTNELFSFVRDNCPNLAKKIDPSRDGSHYIRAYNLTRTEEQLKQRTNCVYDEVEKRYMMPEFGKHFIQCIIVTDNGCRPVRFYNKQTVIGVENHICARKKVMEKRRQELEEQHNKQSMYISKTVIAFAMLTDGIDGVRAICEKHGGKDKIYRLIEDAIDMVSSNGNAHRELINFLNDTEVVHGSFYDPEWFS